MRGNKATRRMRVVVVVVGVGISRCISYGFICGESTHGHLCIPVKSNMVRSMMDKSMVV